MKLFEKNFLIQKLSNCNFHYIVEFLSSMPNIGISFAFPAGIIIEKFGPRWSTLGGAVFSSLGYGLLYSTTFQQQFYHTRAWLQCVYFFIAGMYT